MDEDREAKPTDIKLRVEQHCKLAVALVVIKECFNPMIDPRTNIDMITQALYNRWYVSLTFFFVSYTYSDEGYAFYLSISPSALSEKAFDQCLF